MADVKSLEDKVRRHGERLADYARLQVEDETQDAAHRVTGELANGVTSTAPRLVGGDVARSEIEARAPHSFYYAYGTQGGQLIVPRQAKALHWGGSPGVFAMSVVRGATPSHPEFWSEDTLQRRWTRGLEDAAGVIVT